MKVKGTHIDYFLMIVCFIMAVLGIVWKDVKALWYVGIYFRWYSLPCR